MHYRICRKVNSGTSTGVEERAVQVLGILREEARFGEPFEIAGQNVLFARLYFFTTRRWIDYAKSSSNPDLLLLVVSYFFDLYDQYVGPLSQRRALVSTGHWQLYSRIVDNKNSPVAVVRQSFALLLGIRAHVQFDLAEAICFANGSYQKKFGCPPSAYQFQTMMFGKASDDVFRQASVEFIGSVIGPSKSGIALANFTRALSLMWLPVLQFARKLAWKEAQRSIKTGIPVYRNKIFATNGTGF